MGAASGGRLTFWLVTLAVLMASGAAGVTMAGPGQGPATGSSGPDARMTGSALSQSGADPGTAPATTSARPPAGARAGDGASNAAGRFNVAGAHSPELLRLLATGTAGAAAKSAPSGGAQRPAKAGLAPSTTVLNTAAPSTAPRPTSPGTTSPGTITPGATAPDGTAPDGTAPGGTAPGGTAPGGTGSGARTPAAARAPHAAPAKGVDVAAAQHPGGTAIDWAQIAAAGYTFAAIKSTEGDYYTNPYGAADLAGAKAAGLYVTGYHFAIPNISGGAAQADFALSHGVYAAGGRTARLELDVEYDPYTGIDHTNACYGLSPAQMVSWIGAFGAEAQRLTGQRPVIYTTPSWWAACTGNSTAFAADPLWAAAPAPGAPAGPAGPASLTGWTNWAFWQFTSGATVPGIGSAGNTDVSEAEASRLTLLAPGTRPGATGAAVPTPSAGTSG